MSDPSWFMPVFIPSPSVRDDPVAVCPCPFLGTWLDECLQFPEVLEIISSRTQVSQGTRCYESSDFLKRHYVLVEFLFFRPDFIFSVLDVTRVGVLYTGDIVGKRKNPTLSDGCLLGCFAGDGFVAAGMWSEAAYPYSAQHSRLDEDDCYYQCAEHRHAD